MTSSPEQPAEGTERTAVAVARAAEMLAAAGVSSPRVDAELLAAHVLGVPRSRLLLVSVLSAEQRERLVDLVAERTRRVPVQHLTGRAAFRYLELAVGPGVFVPRPETEMLAGFGIDAARAVRPADPSAANSAGGQGHRGTAVVDGVPARPVVVDLCSGSGAIALSVAHEVPAARVYAVEADPVALRWLRRNARERAAAGDRAVRVCRGDVTDRAGLAGLPVGLRGQVDVVLCNPPYVPRDVAVPPEVADGDPEQAVFGGLDGLSVIRPVLALAAELLRAGGVVGVEHDDTHGEIVPALLARSGAFVEISGHLDLTGRPRFASAIRARGKLLP